MVTMPIAGAMADRHPVGRIVPVGLVVILVGMFGFTQVTDTTPYPVLITFLFIMGLGMGATMMPLFTSALKTLTAHEVARGSTLLNITQQVASSVRHRADLGRAPCHRDQLPNTTAALNTVLERSDRSAFARRSGWRGCSSRSP